MSTLPTPRGHAAANALRVAVVVGACIVIAVRWSELVAGLNLAVGMLAWLAACAPEH
jgi:uncharacterized membrane protein YphA (DoxX/SURF4 family)